jgi:sensor histidine kinase YesM
MKQLPHHRTILQRGIRADVLFWFVYTGATQFAFAPEPLHPINLLIMLAFLSGELVAVYGHLRLGLLPLLNKRIGLPRYLLVVATAIVTGIVVCWGGLLLISGFVAEMRTTLGPVAFLGYWANRIGWSIGTLLALSSGLLLFTHRSRQALRERELQMAKTEAELAYLRGQLNPHFLFNALNSIYLLIDRDPTLARDSLLGFSDLLRYQLYASESATVPLGEEVDQLRKFAALSRLRMEEDFVFDLTAPENPDRHIPPMLLLPLLENAFKYSRREEGLVRAEITLTEGATSFTITNRMGVSSETSTRDDDAGGIGLTNLRRRLKLLYPGRSRLDITRDTESFTVHLELPAA